MKIGGRYLTRESLESWKGRWTARDGDVPSLLISFEFPVLSGGAPECLTMWGMVDTGADGLVVPGLPMGMEMDRGSRTLRIIDGSIASKLALTPQKISGVGGKTEGFSVVANISLAGKKFPDPFLVAICDTGDYQYPLIGRDVLNQFVGLLHPFQRKLLLSDCRCMKGFATSATVFAKSQ